MLEECGLPYVMKAVDIRVGEQFTAEFVAVNPNSKIPAIVDTEGPDERPITLFESGAILVYLAGKSGRFLPASDRGKFEALQWLMFQMGGIGPMLGQTHHFMRYATEKVPYAIDRYQKETQRLYDVLNRRLTSADFLAGEYSIADIATYPWVARHEWHDIDLADYPAVRRWFARISERPAVQRGMAVPPSPQ